MALYLFLKHFQVKIWKQTKTNFFMLFIKNLIIWNKVRKNITFIFWVAVMYFAVVYLPVGPTSHQHNYVLIGKQIMSIQKRFSDLIKPLKSNFVCKNFFVWSPAFFPNFKSLLFSKLLFSLQVDHSVHRDNLHSVSIEHALETLALSIEFMLVNVIFCTPVCVVCCWRRLLILK